MMADEIDKDLAVHALTLFDKQLVEIRTRLAMMSQVSITDFNDLERMLISSALNFKATMVYIEFRVTEGAQIVSEAKRWWSSD